MSDTEKLEAYYGLPEEVKFCKRCVISNQRPSSVVEFKNKPSQRKPTIEFNEDGVCSACQFQDIKATEIDWEARDAELRALKEKYGSRNGSYDCIVPGSGGKDSMFTSHVLKYKYGFNPLTVTWAPHKYTDIGRRNMDKWVASGFDNILVTPNSAVHRKLTQLAFLNLCHPFQPFIVGQRLIGPRFSSMFKVPLVFYGENQAEYGNNISENDVPTMKEEFFMQERDLDALTLGGVTARDLIANHGITEDDLNPYLPAEPDDLRAVGTQVHYLGYYVRWDPQEVYYYVSENCNFEPNTERTIGSYTKYSSMDDLIDHLHYYTTFAKFGIGRATYDAAQEVRNGKIDRDEAVALVQRYDGEYPQKHMKELLEYIDITEEQFHETIDKHRSPHLWKKEGNEWKLRHRVEFEDEE